MSEKEIDENEKIFEYAFANGVITDPREKTIAYLGLSEMCSLVDGERAIIFLNKALEQIKNVDINKGEELAVQYLKAIAPCGNFDFIKQASNEINSALGKEFAKMMKPYARALEWAMTDNQDVILDLQQELRDVVKYEIYPLMTGKGNGKGKKQVIGFKTLVDILDDSDTKKYDLPQLLSTYTANQDLAQRLSTWFSEIEKKYPYRTRIIANESPLTLILNCHYVTDVTDIVGVPNAVAVCITPCAVDNPKPGYVSERIPSYTYIGVKSKKFLNIKELPKVCGGIGDGIYEFNIDPLGKDLPPDSEPAIFACIVGYNPFENTYRGLHFS